VPAKSTGEARKAAREEFVEGQKEERRELAKTHRQQRILEFVREAAANLRPPTKTALREAIGGRNELVIEATDRLVEAGLVQIHHVGTRLDGVIGRAPEILLPTEVDLEVFLASVNGNG
jgi:hypothetical protein